LGATHVFWRNASFGMDTLAGDIMFHHFANRYLVDTQRVGSYRLGRLPPKLEAAPFDDDVLVLGCRGGFGSGLFKVEDLRIRPVGPQSQRYPKPRKRAADAKAALGMIREAGFVARDPACGSAVPAPVRSGFTLASKRGRMSGSRMPQYEVWLRKSR